MDLNLSSNSWVVWWRENLENWRRATSFSELVGLVERKPGEPKKGNIILRSQLLAPCTSKFDMHLPLSFYSLLVSELLLLEVDLICPTPLGCALPITSPSRIFHFSFSAGYYPSCKYDKGGDLGTYYMPSAWWFICLILVNPRTNPTKYEISSPFRDEEPEASRNSVLLIPKLKQLPSDETGTQFRFICLQYSEPHFYSGC